MGDTNDNDYEILFIIFAFLIASVFLIVFGITRDTEGSDYDFSEEEKAYARQNQIVMIVFGVFLFICAIIFIGLYLINRTT